MKKVLLCVTILTMIVSMVVTLSLVGCKTTTAAETTAAETTAAETTAAAKPLIPAEKDIVLSGAVSPRSDDVGPEGDKGTIPSDVSLGGKTFQDYIDMARAGKIEAPADIVSKVKGKTAAIAMHGLDADWPQLQVAGMKMVLEAFGVKIVSVTGGEWKAEVQQANLETVIGLKPNLLLSIPVDQTVEGPIYMEVVKAGIKFVAIDMVPKGLTYKNGDYVTAVSSSSRGNGTAAADIMADYFANTLGLTTAKVSVMRLNFLHQVTEERAIGFENRIAQYYPWIDTSLKSDFDIADIAGNSFATAQGVLTANPDLNGFFAVWDSPASGVAEAARALGLDPKKFAITTSDLSEPAALEIGSDGYIKGLGSQDPFAQGVAEALSGIKSLIGETVPPFIAIPGYAVNKANLLEAYKFILQKEAPDKLKAYFK
ncbi:MAG: substrate-binding domain-containing protein [Candidatus Humimicrobiaceae bacterium]